MSYTRPSTFIAIAVSALVGALICVLSATQAHPAQASAPEASAPTTTVATLADAFPLKPGAQWVYSVTTVTGRPGNLITRTGQQMETVVDVSRVNGVTLYRLWVEQDAVLNDFPHMEPLQYTLLAGNRAYGWNSADPARFIATRGLAGMLVLQWPLSVGQALTLSQATGAKGTAMAWQVIGRENVSTPAGAFADCYHLTIVTNPDDTHAWFCPGVGFVRREYHHHGSIDDMVMVLVSHTQSTVADDHDTDAAINAARLRLSQGGHSDPGLAAVNHVTPTIWLDTCLGLPSAYGAACRRQRTPGYLIELELEQQRYLFRTDEWGERVRLAWSSLPPLRDAFVQWRSPAQVDEPSQVALIGADQLRYGVYGEALLSAVPSPLSAGMLSLNAAQALDWKHTYRPFRLSTARGTLVFTGTGALMPSRAEQRAIAEWANLRVAEATAGYLSADTGVALYWREKSATVCGALWVYQDGWAVAWDCAGQNVTARGLLTPDELTSFYRWMDSNTRWEIEHTPTAGDGQPDATLYFPWHNARSKLVQRDTVGLLPFARALYARLVQQANEKAQRHDPVTIMGLVTSSAGRTFQVTLTAPAEWDNRLAVREEGKTVYFDHDGVAQNTLFSITAYTDAEWQAAQRTRSFHGQALATLDGVTFAMQTALANPYAAPDQQALTDEYQRMSAQVQTVLGRVQIKALP
jgi:hypothetical protein